MSICFLRTEQSLKPHVHKQVSETTEGLNSCRPRRTLVVVKKEMVQVIGHLIFICSDRAIDNYSSQTFKSHDPNPSCLLLHTMIHMVSNLFSDVLSFLSRHCLIFEFKEVSHMTCNALKIMDPSMTLLCSSSLPNYLGIFLSPL